MCQIIYYYLFRLFIMYCQIIHYYLLYIYNIYYIYSQPLLKKRHLGIIDPLSLCEPWTSKHFLDMDSLLDVATCMLKQRVGGKMGGGT